MLYKWAVLVVAGASWSCTTVDLQHVYSNLRVLECKAVQSPMDKLLPRLKGTQLMPSSMADFSTQRIQGDGWLLYLIQISGCRSIWVNRQPILGWQQLKEDMVKASGWLSTNFSTVILELPFFFTSNKVKATTRYKTCFPVLTWSLHFEPNYFLVTDFHLRSIALLVLPDLWLCYHRDGMKIV